jgi:hypothetical protein
MAGLQRSAPPHMEPDLVAPMVAYLCHEECPVSAECYVAGAGRFARLFVALNDGFVKPGDETPTIEDVVENWTTINDETGYYVPATLMDWAGHFMSHRSM